MKRAQINHDELLNAQFVLGDNGQVGYYDRRNEVKTAPCIFTDVSMSEEWFTAMCSIPTLYQQLYQQWVRLTLVLNLTTR